MTAAYFYTTAHWSGWNLMNGGLASMPIIPVKSSCSGFMSWQIHAMIPLAMLGMVPSSNSAASLRAV